MPQYHKPHTHRPHTRGDGAKKAKAIPRVHVDRRGVDASEQEGWKT